MKIREIVGILFARKNRRIPSIVQKKLFYNNVEIKRVFINFFPTPRKMYKIIRNVKTLDNQNIFYVRHQKGFNTMLFKTSFDVVVADKNGKILDIFKECQSNYLSKHYPLGYYVYFMPLGSIDYYKIKTNNLLAPGIMLLKDLNHIGRF